MTEYSKDAFFNEYANTIDARLSSESTHIGALIERLKQLQKDGADPSRLLTAAAGLAAESGEFQEIVKKFVFQGKPYSDENVYHMQRELGDIAFYWVVACISMGVDPHTIIEMNTRKIKDRYPDGFEVIRSERRSAGDI